LCRAGLEELNNERRPYGPHRERYANDANDATDGSPAMMPEEGTRERARQAWRDIHEALYYAADVTKCAQYADYGTLRARRSDICGDLDALRCMEQGGFMPGEAARRYARLHADFTALMRPGDEADDNQGAETFVDAVGELETQIWALVPVERLPVGMFASVDIGQSGRLRLVRRSRRAGDLVL
jgi:hypothetical protein